MNISEYDISQNANTIITLLRKVNRQNANVTGLIAKLESSDFFTAPASTKYHSCIKGGLAKHSLNVYNNLKGLVGSMGLSEVIPEESIIICGLLHDISKMNQYELGYKNVKKYNDNGSKYDDRGRFDWVTEEFYMTKPNKERFQYGNHEETSEYMIRCFIPITLEESIAILHHHGGKGYDSTQQDISYLMSTHPLLTLLHCADMLSTFINEDEEHE